MQRSTRLLTACLCLASLSVHAQPATKAFFGFGGGLDYGGFGIRAEVQPHKNLGFFGGVGYNLADPAYNVGASYKIGTFGRVQPIITAMYGYNAAEKIKYGWGAAYSKSYYGASVGAGCELYTHSLKNKWAFEVLLPFRDKAFKDRYPDMLPVTFTVGYNFRLGKGNRAAEE